MKEVKEFKRKNGNVSYTAKELIGALHQKIDRIEVRLIDGDKEISSIKTWQTAYRIMFGVIFTILCYLVFR